VALGSFEEAAEALERASALPEVSPGLTFDLLFYTGEVNRLWAEGEKSDLESDEIQEFHEAALEAYKKAFAKAQEAELGEAAEDLARLQVGTELRHLGKRDEGIAWLRMGIEDPGDMDPQDLLLARRIAEFLPAKDVLSWQRFLVDPGSTQDPTREMVRTVFDKEPPKPLQAAAQRRFEQFLLLGDSYQGDGRAREALAAYLEASREANSPRERALAACRLGECYGDLLEQTIPVVERAEWDRKRRSALEEGIHGWRQIIREGTAGEAHGAIESAVNSYRRARLPEKALELANQLVTELDRSREPSKKAFAEFQRMRVYDAEEVPFRQLAEVAKGIWLAYRDYKDSDIKEISSLALLWAAHYYGAIRNLPAAHGLLDELEIYWNGQRFQREIAEYRALWGPLEVREY
jgi:tetratricopeptide (TPR) repeat protein